MADDTKERYINPYTDFGFKKLFGTEMNKDLLISFLNALFQDEQVIKDVKYLNSEKLGEGYGDRKAIFDVYCENEDGEKFIVEMKKVEQRYFKDRSVFYSTFPIQKEKIDAALRMKAKGYAVEDIADITKLSIEDIEIL